MKYPPVALLHTTGTECEQQLRREEIRNTQAGAGPGLRVRMPLPLHTTRHRGVPGPEPVRAPHPSFVGNDDIQKWDFDSNDAEGLIVSWETSRAAGVLRLARLVPRGGEQWHKESCPLGSQGWASQPCRCYSRTKIVIGRDLGLAGRRGSCKISLRFPLPFSSMCPCACHVG